jgi:hypothetical protein
MPLSAVQRDENHMVINPDYKVDVEEPPNAIFRGHYCSQLGRYELGRYCAAE